MLKTLGILLSVVVVAGGDLHKLHRQYTGSEPFVFPHFEQLLSGLRNLTNQGIPLRPLPDLRYRPLLMRLMLPAESTCWYIVDIMSVGGSLLAKCYHLSEQQAQPILDPGAPSLVTAFPCSLRELPRVTLQFSEARYSVGNSPFLRGDASVTVYAVPQRLEPLFTADWMTRGGLRHPHGCRPCRFNLRPGGCRFGAQCGYCHGPHQRPNRAQRGRHALDRRPCLQARDGYPNAVRDVMDTCHRIPLEVGRRIERRVRGEALGSPSLEGETALGLLRSCCVLIEALHDRVTDRLGQEDVLSLGSDLSQHGVFSTVEKGLKHHLDCSKVLVSELHLLVSRVWQALNCQEEGPDRTRLIRGMHFNFTRILNTYERCTAQVQAGFPVEEVLDELDALPPQLVRAPEVPTAMLECIGDYRRVPVSSGVFTVASSVEPTLP